MAAGQPSSQGPRPVTFALGDYATISNVDALIAKELGLAAFMPRHQPPVDRHYSPPRQAFHSSQDVANSSGSSGKTCLVGDVAVAHHLTGSQSG